MARFIDDLKGTPSSMDWRKVHLLVAGVGALHSRLYGAERLIASADLDRIALAVRRKEEKCVDEIEEIVPTEYPGDDNAAPFERGWRFIIRIDGIWPCIGRLTDGNVP